MLPEGIVDRPDLKTGSNVLSFGFSEQAAGDAEVVGALVDQLLDHIFKLMVEDTTSTATSAPRLIIVDLRNVVVFPGTGLAKLLSIQERMLDAKGKLVLVLDNPQIREFLSGTHLNGGIDIVTSKEMTSLLAASAPFACQPAALEGQPYTFTEAELAEMTSAGITLADAIRAVEQLRS